MRTALLYMMAGAIAALPLLGSAQDEESAEGESPTEEAATDNVGFPGENGFGIKTEGSLQFSFAGGKQDKNFGKDHSYASSSGNLSFSPFVVLKNGAKAGGSIGFGADASNALNCASGISTAYISVEGVFGTFNFGNQSGAAGLMSVDGTAVLGGQQGAAGMIGSIFNISGGAVVQTGCGADDGIATKLVYMSPTWQGVQFGISYTPNSQSLGGLQNVTNVNYQYHMAGYLMQGNLQNSIDKESLLLAAGTGGDPHSRTNPSSLPDVGTDLSNGAFYLDGITAAVAYNYGSDDRFNGSFAVCGWTGKAKPQVPKDDLEVENVLAWQVGAILGYKQFKVAAGFTDNGKSLMNKGGNVGKTPDGVQKGANMGKVVTAGVSFEQNAWKATAGYYYSFKKYAEKDDETTGQVATVTVDYKFVEGFSVFAEYDHVKTKGRSTKEKREWVNSTNPFEDNAGDFVFVGTKINF
ncbi:MAG: porin [Holosporales bacterium]|jgi:hypothetical protein|nr:porin [Holosporales bacterium]